MSQYAYFYFTRADSPNFEDIVLRHIQYWKTNQPVQYAGGPFADRSGGLILFRARDSEAAERLTANDPFVVEQAIEARWLKQWLPASDIGTTQSG